MSQKTGFDKSWFVLMQVLLVIVGGFFSVVAANQSNGGIGIACFLLVLILSEIRKINFRNDS